MKFCLLKTALVLLWPLGCVAQSATGGVEAGAPAAPGAQPGIKVGRILFGADGSVLTLPAEPLPSPVPELPTVGGEGSAAAGGAELRFRPNGEDLISAEGRRYRRVGNTLFGDDGSTFLELGDRVIGSDGRRYRWVGAGLARRLVPEGADPRSVSAP